jgi:hypothetical protein
MKFKFLLHLIITIVLTILTQIGGVIYLISLVFITKNKANYKLKRSVFFITLYLITTFLIIPNIAPVFGRTKICENQNLSSHNFITKLCNRNYVKSELNIILQDISKTLKATNSELKVVYLDANFPFFDGFPLLPHLSHNDGKKIDISFIYENKNGEVTNLKPSISGYGVFENPKKGEINITEDCKKRGFWQYDFTKYITLGHVNKNLKLSEKATGLLVLELLKHKNISKIFIEPHLKTRLKLNHNKIRFHGCRAVRHDDHIHFQIK